MDVNKIGKFILYLRKEKKLTQFQLGEKLGVSDKTVSKWERGVCLPTPVLVDKLIQFFDISIMEFYAGERNKKLKDDIVNETIKTAVELTKKDTNKKYKKIISSIMLCCVFIIFILLIIFAYSTYDKYNAYEITSSNEKYSANGNLVFGGKDSYISIQNLGIMDEELLNKKGYCFEYRLDLDNVLIQVDGDIYSFEKTNQSELILLKDYVEDISIYIKDDLSDLLKDKDLLNESLSLKIKYFNELMEAETYEMKFSFSEMFSSDKLINK